MTRTATSRKSAPAAKAPKRPAPSKAAAPKGKRALLATDTSPYYQIWVLTNLTAKPFASSFGVRFHLNLTEWRVLLTLADRPGLSAQELSDHTGLDKMNVSRVVRSLEDQGRIVREGSEADRRTLHLYLTDDGWAVYTEIAKAAIAREAQIYSGLSSSELSTLLQLLQKLSASAREPVPGTRLPAA